MGVTKGIVQRGVVEVEELLGAEAVVALLCGCLELLIALLKEQPLERAHVRMHAR